jgi:hypothetical protein
MGDEPAEEMEPGLYRLMGLRVGSVRMPKFGKHGRTADDTPTA